MLRLTFKDHLKILMWKLLVIVHPRVWWKVGDERGSFFTVGQKDAEKLIYKHILSQPTSGTFAFSDRTNEYYFDNLNLRMSYPRGNTVAAFVMHDGKFVTGPYEEETGNYRAYSRPSRWFSLVCLYTIKRYERAKSRQEREKLQEELADIIIQRSQL